MKTKFLLIICCLSSFLGVKSQSFKEINSNNIFSYLSNVSVDMQSKQSASNIIQIGNNNVIEATLINDQLISVQLGNNNQTSYKDYDPTQSAGMLIQSIGNNNLIMVDGSNSISNNMSVEVIGNNKTIFIENR